MQLEDVVVGYARVSTQSQLERGEGLQIQKKRILSYCRDKGLKLSKIYEDKATSGAIRERPALLRLLRDCESGGIKKIIVHKQDRLSRELGVSLWLEERFRENGITIISILEPALFTDDPMTKALRRIISVFSELEKETICSRLREGRVYKAQNGHKGSGPIAFGYVKQDKNLVIKPDEAEWVRRIFKWFVRGRSYSYIIGRLAKAGVRTKRGKVFSIESLKYVLNNSLYCGQSNYGNIHCSGSHEAVISRRLFRKAQNRK